VKIKPYNEMLLLEPVKENTALQMTKESEEKPIKGRVVEMGEHAGIFDFQIGDIVFFRVFMAHEIEYEGKEYYFIHYENILGKEIPDETD